MNQFHFSLNNVLENVIGVNPLQGKSQVTLVPDSHHVPNAHPKLIKFYKKKQ